MPPMTISKMVYCKKVSDILNVAITGQRIITEIRYYAMPGEKCNGLSIL